MSRWGCLLVIVALGSCSGDAQRDVDAGNDQLDPDAAPGESVCGPVEPEWCKVCNPECPSSWPDACNPPDACLADLAEGRCCSCDPETESWGMKYVESFCYPDAGVDDASADAN